MKHSFLVQHEIETEYEWKRNLLSSQARFRSQKGWIRGFVTQEDENHYNARVTAFPKGVYKEIFSVSGYQTEEAAIRACERELNKLRGKK